MTPAEDPIGFVRMLAIAVPAAVLIWAAIFHFI